MITSRRAKAKGTAPCRVLLDTARRHVGHCICTDAWHHGRVRLHAFNFLLSARVGQRPGSEATWATRKYVPFVMQRISIAVQIAAASDACDGMTALTAHLTADASSSLRGPGPT